MEIQELINEGPFITLKPMAVPQLKHTSISSFLSLAGLLIPFLLWQDTLLSYLLVLSPLYLVYCSKYLSLGLFLTAVFWPKVTETNLLMRILLILDALYISIASKRSIKYKMTPTKVSNTDFGFII